MSCESRTYLRDLTEQQADGGLPLLKQRVSPGKVLRSTLWQVSAATCVRPVRQSATSSCRFPWQPDHYLVLLSLLAISAIIRSRARREARRVPQGTLRLHRQFRQRRTVLERRTDLPRRCQRLPVAVPNHAGSETLQAAGHGGMGA